MTGAEKTARMERALAWAGPTHRISDVVDQIKAGRAQFWENGDGCIVTELEQFPLMKTVRYWLIFGDLRDCLALDERITRWAVGEGCTVGVASGRKGWARAGAPYGWRQWHSQYVKDLVP